MRIEIEKVWDGNEREHEDARGRVHVSRGRWQWLVVVDGTVESSHDRKRDAATAAAFLQTKITDEGRAALAAAGGVQ